MQRDIACDQRKGRGALGVLGMVALVAGLCVIYGWMFFDLEPGEELTLWGTVLQVVLPIGIGLFLLATILGAISLTRPNPILVIKSDGLWFRDYGGFVPYHQLRSISFESTESYGEFLSFRFEHHDQQMARSSTLGRMSAWVNSMLDIPPIALSPKSTDPSPEEILRLVQAQSSQHGGRSASDRTSVHPPARPPGSGRQARPEGGRPSGRAIKPSGRQIKPSGRQIKPSGRPIRPSGRQITPPQAEGDDSSNS